MFKLPETNNEFQRLVKIIDSKKAYPLDRYRDYFAKAQKKELSEKEVKLIIKDFKSDQYGFDDVYKLKLAVCDWLINIDQKSDDFVRFLDWDAKTTFKKQSVGIAIPSNFYTTKYVNTRREALRSYGEKLLILTREEIEARLAILELFATILPDDLIPELLLITPKYLGCKRVQAWVTANQFQAIHGDINQKKVSKENLKNFTKAITPDARKSFKQTTRYWQLDSYYNKLTSYIKMFRRTFEENNFNPQYFKAFMQQWRIPKVLEGHFKSSEMGAKELAMEVMTLNNLIVSEVAFRDFQPKINKLKQKHAGIQLSLVLEDVLDLPLQYPQMLDNPKIWDLLD